MKRELIAQVGADGVLILKVVLARKDANKMVRVLVEIVEGSTSGSPLSQEDWVRFVHGMAGRITDPTFECQPQGEYEQRDELS